MVGAGSSSGPGWILVAGGRCRCSRCGAFVVAAWCWFPEPTVWTLALCEPCVELEVGD